MTHIGEGCAESRLLTSVVIIPVDSRLARFAGYLRREYRVKTADSAIAATALLTHTTLVSRNAQDFQRIPTLSLLPI
jgi:predicted nucleic acid-binding protein